MKDKWRVPYIKSVNIDINFLAKINLGFASEEARNMGTTTATTFPMTSEFFDFILSEFPVISDSR